MSVCLSELSTDKVGLFKELHEERSFSLAVPEALELWETFQKATDYNSKAFFEKNR